MVDAEVHARGARRVGNLADDVAVRAHVHGVPREGRRARPVAEAFVVLARGHDVARAGAGKELRPRGRVEEDRVEARRVLLVREAGRLRLGNKGHHVRVLCRHAKPLAVEGGHAEDAEVDEDAHLGVRIPLWKRPRVERRPGRVVAHVLRSSRAGRRGAERERRRERERRQRHLCPSLKPRVRRKVDPVRLAAPKKPATIQPPGANHPKTKR